MAKTKRQTGSVFLADNTTYMATVQNLLCWNPAMQGWKCWKILKSPEGTFVFNQFKVFLSSSAVSPSNDWNQCAGPNFFAALLPYENDAGVCFVLPFPITQWVNFVACLVSGTAGRQKETELFVRDEMLGCQLL